MAISLNHHSYDSKQVNSIVNGEYDALSRPKCVNWISRTLSSLCGVSLKLWLVFRSSYYIWVVLYANFRELESRTTLTSLYMLWSILRCMIGRVVAMQVSGDMSSDSCNTRRLTKYHMPRSCRWHCMNSNDHCSPMLEAASRKIASHSRGPRGRKQKMRRLIGGWMKMIH